MLRSSLTTLARPSILFRSLSTTTTSPYKGNGVLGIVEETYNKWERRCPLTPSHVRELVKKQGYAVLVQVRMDTSQDVNSHSCWEAGGGGKDRFEHCFSRAHAHNLLSPNPNMVQCLLTLPPSQHLYSKCYSPLSLSIKDQRGVTQSLSAI